MNAVGFEGRKECATSQTLLTASCAHTAAQNDTLHEDAKIDPLAVKVKQEALRA